MAILFLFVLCTQAEPKPGTDFAAGVILGEPTGVSLKLTRMLVLDVSWDLRDDRFFVSLDRWLINNKIEHPVWWYLGLGGGIGAFRHTMFAFRIPVGLQIPFMDHFEFFAELVPGMELITETRPLVFGGIGLRYHF